jgi:putative cell wall-binding protein
LNILRNVILLLILLIPVVSAEDVLLVSENCADYCSAASVASTYEDMVVITTIWGDYDSEVLDQILSYDPETVMIVGGTVAVAEEYEDNLVLEGIEVERIYGLDRYSTNEQLLDRFRDRLRDRDVCILYGGESTSNICNSSNSVVILTDGSEISVDSELLGNFNTSNIDIVTTPLFNGQTIRNNLENMGYQVNTRTMAQSELEENVLRIRNNLQIRIENMENNGINATALRENLSNIDSMINAGQYQQAYANGAALDGTLSLYQYQYRNKRNSTGVSKQNQMQPNAQNSNQIGGSSQISGSMGSGSGK